jgi:hypothetical protein
MAFGTAEFRRKKCLDPFPSEHMAKYTHHPVGDNAWPHTTAEDGHATILVHLLTFTAWTGPSPWGSPYFSMRKKLARDQCFDSFSAREAALSS